MHVHARPTCRIEPRGVYRLQPVRAGLPDRHRHPQGPAVRVHWLRRLCRRVRHGDGKMGYPRGLVKYTTENAMTNQWTTAQTLRHVLRPRILIYTSILLGIVIAMGVSLALRTPFKVNVVRDRGVMSRIVSGGKIENVYQLQVMNATESTNATGSRRRACPAWWWRPTPSRRLSPRRRTGWRCGCRRPMMQRRPDRMQSSLKSSRWIHRATCPKSRFSWCRARVGDQANCQPVFFFPGFS